MFFFKLTVLYLLIYGILFLSGWGICEKICKGKNIQYKFLLAPIIGIMPLSVVPMYLSFLGVKTSISGWFTFTLFAFISLYSLIKNPSFFKETNYHSPYLLLFLILAVCPSFAVLLKAGYLTTTLQSYSAPAIYLSEYFSQNSAIDKVNLNFYKPITNMIVEISNITPFVGYFFSIAAISSIFNIPPYKLYLILSGIAGSFIPISVYIACIEGFKLEKRMALLISFLISINISYFFWPLIGHLPFITGIAYLILALGFMPNMFHCSKKADYVFYSLIMAGMMSMYFQLAPYIVGVALLYIFSLSCIKNPQSALKSIKNFGIISLITFVITPFVFIFLGRYSLKFTTITSKFTTNIPRYPYLEELLGFGSHFSMSHDGSMQNYSIILVSTLSIIFICTGIYERFKNRDTLFLSIFGFIFSLGCYFFATDFTYHFYKNSVIGVFIIICSVVTGGIFIYEKSQSLFIKQSVVALLVVFVALNLNTYSKISFFSSHPVITGSMMELEKMSNIVPEGKRILVNANNPTEEAWLSYFLRNNKIKLRGLIEPWGFWIMAPYTGKPNTNFFYDYTKDSIDYTLTPKIQYQTDIIETDYGDTVYENDGFVLSKNVPKPYLLKGWFNVEKNNAGVWRWTKKNSFVLFDEPGNDSMLYIDGAIPALYNKSLEIKIKINENLIDKFYSDSLEIKKRYSLKNIPLKKSNNVLAIILNKTFSPNEKLGFRDLRRLGIMINAINFFDLENFEIDRVIDIGNSQFDRFLLSGWSRNESSVGKEDFSWVEGKNASLRIFVENTEDMEMQFRAHPFTFPENPLQEMSIYLNNKFVNKITMKNTGWELYKTAIPSDVLQKGLNTVQFSFSYSETPALVLKNNTDLREISAAFDYIKFSEVPGQKE